MTVTTIMIIIWSTVIAGTLLLEFFTVDFFACCFSVGAIVSLILAICHVDIIWQLLVFFIVTIIAICATRPLVKKLMSKQIPTNIDKNFGKTTHLLADVVDGLSSIKINDVIWTVVCNADLKKNDLVTIENVEGNKMIVKPVNSAEASAETVEKAVSKNKKKN